MASTSIRPMRALAAAMLLAGGMALSATAHAGDVLNRVVSSGTVRIAAMGGLPPYSTLTPAGELVGYSIDVGKLLAKDLGVKAEFVVVDSPGRTVSLQTGKADLTVTGFARDMKRSLTVAFSDPYLIIAGEMVVKSDSPLKDMDALNDPKYKISLNRGGNSDPVIQARFPKAQLLHFNANSDLLAALMSGQVDAMASDSFYNISELKNHPGQLRVLPGAYSRLENAIGTPAGDADWLRVINLWIEQFNASGDNAKLFRQWFGSDPPKIQANF